MSAQPTFDVHHVRIQYGEARLIVPLLLLLAGLTSCAHDGDGSPTGAKRDDRRFETVAYVNDLAVLRLKGDAYARGYQLGTAVGNQIVDVYEKVFLQSQLGYDPKYILLYRLLRNTACNLIQYTDEEMQQIHGVTDGIRDHWGLTAELPDGTTLELDENDLCIGNALSDLAKVACSSVSAWGTMTADGETIIARNLDWDAGPDNVIGPMNMVVTETPEDESWSFVKVTIPGFFGCLSCMNGEGDAAFLHDAPRWNTGLRFRFVPRGMTMRRALLAAQGAADDLEAFESVVEQDGVVSGTNFHFVRGAGGGRKGGACFEADDNKAHPDGSVTLRTDLDHAAAATDLSDVLFVTNVYRKRYEPGSCDRYDSMRATVEAMTGPEGATLTLADLRRMMNAVEFRGGLVETFHTVLFKPSDFTLTVARIGPDHWASEDPGVTVPPDVLFPWKDAR